MTALEMDQHRKLYDLDSAMADLCFSTGTARTLFLNPLHPYTAGLMNSFPSIGGKKQKLTGIPGSPPDLSARPTGCRFQPRCPRAMKICTEKQPELKEAQQETVVAAIAEFYEGTTQADNPGSGR